MNNYDIMTTSNQNANYSNFYALIFKIPISTPVLLGGSQPSDYFNMVFNVYWLTGSFGSDVIKYNKYSIALKNDKTAKLTMLSNDYSSTAYKQAVGWKLSDDGKYIDVYVKCGIQFERAYVTLEGQNRNIVTWMPNEPYIAVTGLNFELKADNNTITFQNIVNVNNSALTNMSNKIVFYGNSALTLSMSLNTSKAYFIEFTVIYELTAGVRKIGKINCYYVTNAGFITDNTISGVTVVMNADGSITLGGLSWFSWVQYKIISNDSTALYTT